MPCFHPLTAWRSGEKTAKGYNKVIFAQTADSLPCSEFKLPCGRCVGCRLEYSRQWAVRCLHEASLYDDNAFITLTYNDDNLPKNGSLDPRSLQLFFKRFRKQLEPQRIRFYACGEYGDTTGRPHYHAIVFGWWPRGAKRISARNGHNLYSSSLLDDVWPYGYNSVGAVSFESAAYVARYIMKKVNGDKADEHYMRVDPDTGEVVNLQPEFTRMSRRPGIAHEWYEKYKSDVYPSDNVVVNGRVCKPPAYYDRQLEAADPGAYEIIRESRRDAIRASSSKRTPDRLAAAEAICKAKISQLTRGL